MRALLPAVVVCALAWPAAATERGVTVVPREVTQIERGRRWAVLIGVDKYDDEVGIGSLKHCGADMKLLHRILTGPNGGFAPENVLLMTQDAKEARHSPTYSHIVSLIPVWLREAKPEDDVLIAFSGHGITEGGEAYLLPSTAMRSNPRLTAIPLSLVRDWMDACQARRKILVLDACHSGAGKDSPVMDKRFWADVDQGKGFVKLASCAPDQKSNEDPDLTSIVGKGHGVFTFYLAEALDGAADYDQDGRVDVDEAYRYAYGKTRHWARNKGITQDPMKSGQVTGVVTLGYYRDIRQLQEDRQAAQTRLKDLEKEAAAQPDAEARKAIEEARRREFETIRKIEERVAQLQVGADATAEMKRYEVARLHVEALEKELDSKRKEYTEKSSVVQALLEKIEEARSQREKARESARGPLTARLVALLRQQREMSKELLPSHAKMVELAEQIRRVDEQLRALSGDWVRLSGGQILSAIHDGVPSTLEIPVGAAVLRMVYIPGGEFSMGSPETVRGRSAQEGPVHSVEITRPFYMSVYEITQAQYEAVMQANPSRARGPDLPVHGVTWDEAVAFCEKLSGMTGSVFRLPTEAEWEYACRAGINAEFGWGEDSAGLENCAWYSRNTRTGPQPVGRKEPNRFGLYDMHGNVMEWCADWHNPYYYRISPLYDPAGPVKGEQRVLRGGAWAHSTDRLRCAARMSSPPDRRDGYAGFRVVQEIPLERKP